MARTVGKKDIFQYLEEDSYLRDVTSLAVIPEGAKAVGELIAERKGVVSGVGIGLRLCRHVGLKVRADVRDGEEIRPRQRLLSIWGRARTLLGTERTLVNLLMHLSGVATETREMVRRAESVKNGFRIAATRKTLPGLREFEKMAVVDGGGEAHRRDLSSAILIKKNHARIVGLSKALLMAKHYARRNSNKIMVEVGNAEEAIAATQAGAKRLLLDNLSPSQVKKVIGRLEDAGLRQKVVVEVTGGISQANVAAYASTGADVASSGHITHSAPALPMHMVVRPWGRKT